MKTRLLLFLLLSLFSLGAVHSAPVDLSAPSNSLGAANAHGYVQIWREIDEVDFGGGLKLPLRIRFSSEPQRESTSTPLGVGFWCPLTDAKAYLKREKMLRCELICGKVMYLRRDKKDFSKFSSPDKQWTAVLDAEKNKITLSRSDGWELRYEAGVLRQLKTDSDRLLTWVRNGNTVTEIREEGSADSSLRLVIGSGGAPNGFFVNGKLHSFEMGKRPRIEEISGQNVVAGFDRALATWKWPDGTQESFQFEVNDEIQPDLKVTNKDGSHGTYVWNAPGATIVSSDDESGQWSYKVGKTTNDTDLPKLDRWSKKGEIEFLYVDKQRGITEKNSLFTGHTITEVFQSAGPLYGKIRKIEQISGDTRSVFYQAGYDEGGRLLREVDAKGFITTYTYAVGGGPAKKAIRPPSDPKLLDYFARRESELLTSVQNVSEQDKRDRQLAMLGYFYIDEKRDIQSGYSVVEKIVNQKIRYDLEFHTIAADMGLSRMQRIEKLNELLIKNPEESETLSAIIAFNKKLLTKEQSEQ